MNLSRPIRAQLHAQKGTSTLVWSEAESAEFRMRGGVCWPAQVNIGGRREIQGYALLAGEDIKTKIVWVFEEMAFMVSSNVMRADGTIEYPGVAPWFTRQWSTYYGLKYFWHQPDELTRRFRLEVGRDPMANPKPVFIEVPWQDYGQAAMMVWESIQLERLRFAKSGQLATDLTAVVREDREFPASVHALMCCLVGLKLYPYREPLQR